MRLIDSHSHLFLEEFAEDLPQVMARAREAGVTHIFMPNIDSTTIGPMLRVCREYKGYCYPMIGLHPTSVGADYEKELEIVARELASPNEFVAVGEIGMDLYWDKTFLREQQRVLDKQIEWALEYGLPVVLHCREAFDHIYNVLKIFYDQFDDRTYQIDSISNLYQLIVKIEAKNKKDNVVVWETIDSIIIQIRYLKN